MTNGVSSNWQYYRFSDNVEYDNLHGKHEHLVRKFSSMSSKDMYFDRTYINILKTEKQIADLHKEDWLNGCYFESSFED